MTDLERAIAARTTTNEAERAANRVAAQQLADAKDAPRRAREARRAEAAFRRACNRPMPPGC